MVILNKNPLEDIQHTKDIHRVIKGGRIYTQEELLDTIPSKEYLDEERDKFMKEYEKMKESNS